MDLMLLLSHSVWRSIWLHGVCCCNPKPGVTETAAVLLEDTACQVLLHLESLERDAALLDNHLVHLQSAQLLRQDHLELSGQDNVCSGQ